MSTVHRLLCPIDFSDSSDAALAYASELAQQLGAELHVLHTWQLSAYADPSSELAKDTERGIEKDVDAAIARSVPKTAAVHRHIRLGPAPATIVQAIDDLQIDHVVMGTNGKTGLERLIVGSVAEEVVRRADVPVTTVRARRKR